MISRRRHSRRRQLPRRDTLPRHDTKPKADIYSATIDAIIEEATTIAARHAFDHYWTNKMFDD